MLVPLVSAMCSIDNCAGSWTVTLASWLRRVVAVVLKVRVELLLCWGLLLLTCCLYLCRYLHSALSPSPLLSTLPPTLPLVTPSTPSPSFSYQWRMICNVNLIFTKDWFFSKCPKCSFSGWRLKRSHLIYWTTNYVLGNYQNCAMIR